MTTSLPGKTPMMYKPWEQQCQGPPLTLLLLAHLFSCPLFKINFMEVIYRELNIHPFWVYISQCFDKFTHCMATITVKTQYSQDFRSVPLPSPHSPQHPDPQAGPDPHHSQRTGGVFSRHGTNRCTEYDPRPPDLHIFSTVHCFINPGI